MQVNALNDLPQLTPEESFYFSAFSTLDGAGYADIIAYCKDYQLSLTEKNDLLAIIETLAAHRRKLNADS